MAATFLACQGQVADPHAAVALLGGEVLRHRWCYLC